MMKKETRFKRRHLHHYCGVFGVQTTPFYRGFYNDSFIRLGPGRNQYNIYYKQETHKQNFHGIVPGLSRDSLGLFLRCSGIFVYVFPFSPGKRQTHKQFDPRPFPGQSRKVVYVYSFFFPEFWVANKAILQRFLQWLFHKVFLWHWLLSWCLLFSFGCCL